MPQQDAFAVTVHKPSGVRSGSHVHAPYLSTVSSSSLGLDSVSLYSAVLALTLSLCTAALLDAALLCLRSAVSAVCSFDSASPSSLRSSLLMYLLLVFSCQSWSLALAAAAVVRWYCSAVRSTVCSTASSQGCSALLSTLVCCYCLSM
jgi:hypothetical protein